MSNLTRIKNNQITDSTILANVKVVPGSIVGSLFNSNLTMSSDVTITGNLTVQGSSTYLTVASTNTYVNDPLIVLNNAFAGTNTYDIGLIINRGSLTDTAWIWNESNDRFEATYTTDPGTTYGTINNSGYASVKVGNIAVHTLTDTRVLFADSNSNIVDSSAFTYTANVLTVNNFEFNDTNNTITLSASGGSGNITIESPGGLVDFFGGTLGNIASPVNNDDAVSLGYLNSQISSGVTNIQLDDTDVTITDDGVAAGVITANIDATQILSATANNTAFYGTDNTSLLYLDDLNSNVRINGATYANGTLETTGNIIFNNNYLVGSTTGSGTGPGYMTLNSYWANIKVQADNASVYGTYQFGTYQTYLGPSIYTYFQIQDDTNPAEPIKLRFGNQTLFSANSSQFAFKNKSSGGAIDVSMGANLYVGGNVVTTGTVYGTGGLSGTLLTAAQPNVTSLGNLTTLHVDGVSTFGANVTIEGNLRVNGNVTYINANNLSINDSMIYLADDNPADTLDIGIVSAFTNPGYQHTGFVRDATDGVWKLFANVVAEPTETIDFTYATYSHLQIGNLIANNVGGTLTTAAQPNVTSLGTLSALTVSGNVTTGGLKGNLKFYTSGNDFAGEIRTTFARLDFHNEDGTKMFGFEDTQNTVNFERPLVVSQSQYIAAVKVDANYISGSANLLLTSGGSANVIIGTDETTPELIVDTGTIFANANVKISKTTATTSYTTGALQVAGGVGIAGNVFTKSGGQFVIGEELITSTIRGNLVTYSPMHILADHNANSRVIIQNINSGANASIGIAFAADNGSEDDHFLDIGINNSNRDDGMLAPNDAFIHVAGGNLMLGSLSPEQYIHFHIGTMANASSMVQELTPNGVMIMKDTISTDHHTGALVVEGGVGIVANLNIGDGAVINSHQSHQPFRVYGNIATSLIYADSDYDHVVIGGSNVTIQPGVTLKVNSTSAMMIPVGATADRPSNSGNVDVAGMIRYNTSTTNLEYYTGTEWKVASNESNFTLVTSEQFNGDDSTVNFTLGNATTTTSCVVAINGIMQIPSTAYTIAGNLLTFTEAPATGDVIDVRVMTITTTVGDLTSPNGLNTVTPNNADGVRFFSGTTTGNKTLRATYGPGGMYNLVNGTKTSYDQTVTNIASSATPVIIDEFATSSYSTAKYIIQAKNGSNKLESMEALVVSEDGNASVVTYGIVNSHGASMGTLSANVVSGNCRLYYTSTSLSNSNVKVLTTYIV